MKHKDTLEGPPSDPPNAPSPLRSSIRSISTRYCKCKALHRTEPRLRASSQGVPTYPGSHLQLSPHRPRVRGIAQAPFPRRRADPLLPLFSRPLDDHSQRMLRLLIVEPSVSPPLAKTSPIEALQTDEDAFGVIL